jgi:threonine/homoserine/homoserine lactone efflux protein
MHVLLAGIGIGLSIAAPVGPIGILCIRRTLAGGLLSGLVSGLGAATADAAYGAVAAFGLTAISRALVHERRLLGMVGGAFLIWLAVKTVRTRPLDEGSSSASRGLAGDYLSTLLLTLANPTTILSFVGIFMGLGLIAAASTTAAVQTVVGVFVGSALWWLCLSATVGAARMRLSTRAMVAVNWISGSIILAFGVASMIMAIR